MFDAATLDITWPIEHGQMGMEARLAVLCDEAARYVDNGANILILSDRNLGPERVAMPSRPAETLRGNPQLAIAEPASNHPVVQGVGKVVTNHATGVRHRFGMSI